MQHQLYTQCKKNIIVLGSGRSGTSMLAGCFAKSGYFMGDELWDAREANPKGFFEDREINEINEDLLEAVTPSRLKFFGKTFFRHRPIKWQRWLAILPLNIKITSSPALDKRIQKIVNRQPFCFKDPRFSYTLAQWRPFLENTVYICVFRDPATSARSTVKETTDYVKKNPQMDTVLNYSQALTLWEKMYTHILEKHCIAGEWLFVHYEQIVTGEAFEKIQEFTGTEMDPDFPEKRFNRSSAKDEGPLPARISAIYQRLCSLANYKAAE